MGTGPGRAYPHRIPLTRLNGVSEKRVRELAGRLLPSREASDRDYNPLCPPPLRPDSRDERRLQSSLAFGSVGPTTRPQAHRPSFANHRPHRAQVAAPLSTAGTARPPRTVPRSSSPARQDSRPRRTAGRRSAPALVYLRRSPSHPRVRSPPPPSCPGAHLAPARSVAKTPAPISTHTRPRPPQGHRARLSADLRRHQGSRRYPPFWPQAQAFDLPAVEDTAREVRSGLLFWAFSQRRSAAASSVFAARIQPHLARCGISLRALVWQTDNGSEFIGGDDRRGHPTGFPTALGDSQQERIPPAAPTFQSDETVHRLVEDEFFDRESFTGRGDFLAKAFTYQLYFNLPQTKPHSLANRRTTPTSLAPPT